MKCAASWLRLSGEHAYFPERSLEFVTPGGKEPLKLKSVVETNIVY